MNERVDPDVLRGLFATPPPEFVAARNARVKELRAARQRDAAAAVGALRRPNWTDWALNATARSAPAVVDSFAGAAALLREAQDAAIEGRAGPELRTALRELRDATAALARAAGTALTAEGRTPDVADIAARLGEVATSAGAVDQLRAGVLGSADPDDSGLFADLPPIAPAAPAAPARSEPAPPPPAELASARRRSREAQREDDQRRRREGERARRKAQERERRAAELAAAEAELEAALSAVTAAEAALDAARDRRDAARRHLTALRKRA